MLSPGGHPARAALQLAACGAGHLARSAAPSLWAALGACGAPLQRAAASTSSGKQQAANTAAAATTATAGAAAGAAAPGVLAARTGPSARQARQAAPEEQLNGVKSLLDSLLAAGGGGGAAAASARGAAASSSAASSSTSSLRQQLEDAAMMGPAAAAAMLQCDPASSSSSTSQRHYEAAGGVDASSPPPPPPSSADEAVAAAAAASATTACGPAAAAAGEVRMDSAVLFDACWRRFRERHGTNFAAPREIVWLNGAPGAGKGVSTPHILKARGATRSVCVSSLLTAAAEARSFIDAGEMIADAVVGDLLLEAILQPLPPASGGSNSGGGISGGGSSGSSGSSSIADPVAHHQQQQQQQLHEPLSLVVDGFPRTAVQVDFLKLLETRLWTLHKKYVDTPWAWRFPRPSFKVVVLYVDEQTSVARQLQRARAAAQHNARAKDAGLLGHLQEERATDADADKARKRYATFRAHYSALLRLKMHFPFHLIDAMGSIADTVGSIADELRYQSSLDLSEGLYAKLRRLPTSKELQRSARAQLVGRLEASCSTPLFDRVLALFGRELVPVLRRGALAGAAEWVSQDPLFDEEPHAVDVLLDVLADRGYAAVYVSEPYQTAVSLDSRYGTIRTRAAALHRFRLTFDAPGAPGGGRDDRVLRALEVAARITEAARAAAASAAAAAAATAAGIGGGAGGAAGSSAAAAMLGAAAAGVGGGAHAPGLPLPPPAAPITASSIPSHLDLEAKMRQQQQQQQQHQQQQTAPGSERLPRVALAPGQDLGGAAAAAAAAADCDVCAGNCPAEQPQQQQQQQAGGAAAVMHRCLRPDFNCGHAQEVEVVSASG